MEILIIIVLGFGLLLALTGQSTPAQERVIIFVPEEPQSTSGGGGTIILLLLAALLIVGLAGAL